MAVTNQISPDQLADYVLYKLGGTSHIKLQKLVYYIDAWHLATFGSPIVREEFEAWLHGPVLRSLFSRFRGEGYLMYDGITLSEDRRARVEAEIIPSLAEDQIDLIEDVLGEYGSKPAYHLECLTHSEQPWIEARRGVPDGEASSNRISKEVTRRYYESRFEQQ